MTSVGPVYAALVRFARQVGHGVSAGNAIRHGRPLSPAAAEATAARDEPPPAAPPAVTPGPVHRDRPYLAWDGSPVRVRDGS